jgi:phosphoserine phosphatase RsbU/P
MIVDDLDTAPCGYLCFADTGVILKVNKTLITLLGYAAAEQLVGRNVESIFTIATRIFYQTHFFPILKLQGKADELFFTLKGADKQECPFICNAARKREGDVAANHCIFVPAIQRSKYEQELLKARQDAETALSQNRDLLAAKEELEKHSFLLDRRLGELSRMNEDIVQFGRLISHDLQEPIRKIAIFAERLTHENDGGFDQATIDRLNKINRECFQLRRLTFNLERFLSLNSHEEPLGKVDLSSCVQAALLTAREANPVDELNFTVGELPMIQGYRRELELLFSQVFANSIQNRDTKRSLSIRVECSWYQENVYKRVPDRYRYVDFVKILVIDNGKGFAKGEAESFFNIQRRLEKLSRELSFGLAFCKKVVDNHFGTISIEPLDSGGAVVAISLPFAPE